MFVFLMIIHQNSTALLNHSLLQFIRKHTLTIKFGAPTLYTYKGNIFRQVLTLSFFRHAFKQADMLTPLMIILQVTIVIVNQTSAVENRDQLQILVEKYFVPDFIFRRSGKEGPCSYCNSSFLAKYKKSGWTSLLAQQGW